MTSICRQEAKTIILIFNLLILGSFLSTCQMIIQYNVKGNYLKTNWAFATLWQKYKGVTYHTWMNWLTQRGTFERILLHHPQNIAIWVDPRRRNQDMQRQFRYLASILLFLSEIKLSILTTANEGKTSHQHAPINPFKFTWLSKIFTR